MNVNFEKSQAASAAEREGAHKPAESKQKLLVETVGKLTGGIAHKFNNLLTIIQGNAQLLMVDTPENTPSHDSLKEILNATSQAAEITRQLLSFGRREPVSYTPIDINTIINDVMQIIRPECDPKIQISEHLDSESPMVIGDYGLVHSALLSLLVNARESMPEGGQMELKTSIVVVESSAKQRDLQPGQYVDICIHDTGKGLTARHSQRLSRNIAVFDSPTEQNLQTAYECVKQLKGTIKIDSEPDKGTDVHMYIPAMYSTESTGTSPADQQHILIVDDDQTILALIGRMLQKLGYFVSTCTNGQEAANFYRKNNSNIDLVIVDIIMPGMNGFETLEALKKINPKVRALLSSGFTAETERNHALQLGFIDFLEKPFQFENLKATVEKCLPKKT